jgi:hypothetical protein
LQVRFREIAIEAAGKVLDLKPPQALKRWLTFNGIKARGGTRALPIRGGSEFSAASIAMQGGQFLYLFQDCRKEAVAGMNAWNRAQVGAAREADRIVP